MGYGGRSPRLNLVEVTEEVESGPTTAIVQLSLGEDSQQRALTSLGRTNHSDTQVEELAKGQRSKVIKVRGWLKGHLKLICCTLHFSFLHPNL